MNKYERLFLTLSEFADALCISRALARKWAKLGKIKIVRLGRCVRIPADELERVIREGVE
jgi:excisionase family DNA binding protein